MNESAGKFDENRCPHGNLQPCEICKHERFDRGEISNEEIREYWTNPERSLATQIIETKDGKSEFEIKGLNDDYLRLLKNLWKSWDLVSFVGLAKTLEAYRDQRRNNSPSLLEAEYYTAVDSSTKQPVGITGLYTLDIYGPGFSSIDKLNKSRHNFSTGYGWFAVSKKYQGIGLGKQLFSWTENLAKTRGASHMFIETDTAPNERRAVELYERRGYTLGFHTPDYFGPGRDLDTYYADISDEKIDSKKRPQEKINDNNKNEILELAKRIYTEERFEEFEVGFNLLMGQKDKKGILEPHTFVNRDSAGRVESFAIMFTGAAYNNVVINSWYGSADQNEATTGRMIDGIKSVAANINKGVIMVPREGADPTLIQYGFQTPQHGIPRVFGKNDETEFLLYTKKLNN